MKKKKIMPIILLIISAILVIGFLISIRLDWLNHYEHINTPYYKCVLKTGLEFLLPAVISLITGIVLLKKNK